MIEIELHWINDWTGDDIGFPEIARDGDDECVYVYKSKPIKGGVFWETELGCYQWSVNDDSLPFIKWEDEEPTKILDLMQDYESHQVITGENILNNFFGTDNFNIKYVPQFQDLLSSLKKDVEKEKLYTVDLNFNQALGKRNGVIKFYDPNDKFWIVERKLTKDEIESVNPILMKIAKEVE